MTESILFKIITAGDGNVGKTTLLQRYVKGQFMGNIRITIGVEFSVKELNLDDTRVTLQLWDFSGQKHLRYMLDHYAYGAKGALYMFDLNDIENSLRNTEIWWSLINKAGPIPVILIGTKHDLVENGGREQYESNQDRINEVREKFNYTDYIETSSKTGHNVLEVFNVLVKEMLNREGIEFEGDILDEI